MVLGCSTKQPCKVYSPLIKYTEPPDLVMDIPASKGIEAERDALRKALKQTVTKILKQKATLKLYKKQVDTFNTWLEEK